MSEMFKIFLENLQGQISKFSNTINNLQDCTIDRINKNIEEGESIYDESMRTVTKYNFIYCCL